MRELAGQEESPVDWQPQILLFTETAERRSRVLALASWISGGTGMVTAVQLIEGQSGSELARSQQRAAERQLRAALEADDLDAFPLVVVAPDLESASMTLLQAWGVGPVRANTVALNWLEHHNEPVSRRYARVLRRIMRLRQNVVVFDAAETDWVRLEQTKPHRRRIDVWWFDDDSSRLALLFAHLMTRTDDWDDATIRLLVPAPADSGRKVAANLAQRLEDRRIDAEIVPVADADRTAVVAQSRDAAIVLLPLRVEGMQLLDPFGDPVEEILRPLPLVTLVAAAQDILLRTDGEDLLPPGGQT
ncbi:Solute carrier family 12 member 7 [Geodia barretti]|uniref:Solute carrier family 12 member 7 n=1 Tax=Geodia barretti TaxID=519541 RepID=A0AA35QZ77_GEOBA|nr:Solute carrier family 12 member 7 [Geodia barretti]